MLQNEYLVVKIGVDTAENEPKRKSDVPPSAKPAPQSVAYNGRAEEGERLAKGFGGGPLKL